MIWVLSIDALLAWIVLIYTCGRVEGLYWSQWIKYCSSNECFQSRYVCCKVGNRIRYRKYCVEEGEVYMERWSSQCNDSLCRQWSPKAVVSRCEGSCHNSMTTHQYNCTTLDSCTKTLFKKCLNKATCTGTWTPYINGTCDAKCGYGAQIVWERCMAGSEKSISCLGSNGTTYFRKRKIECDDCFMWSEWSTWSECNESCFRNRTRTCSFDATSSRCKDKEYKDVESCLEDECYPLPNPSKNVHRPFSDNRYFLILIAGGVIGGIVIIFVVWTVIRRNQRREPKMDDNKTGQIYITEIDRYSPNVDGPPRKTYSFGSHYEILDGEVYSEPFDSAGWKQKRSEAKSTSTDIYAVPSRKKKEKAKNTENEIFSYRDSAQMHETQKTLTFFNGDIYSEIDRVGENSIEDSTYPNLDAEGKYGGPRTNEQNFE